MISSGLGKRLLILSFLVSLVLSCQESGGSGGGRAPTVQPEPRVEPTSDTGSVTEEPAASPAAPDGNGAFDGQERLTGTVNWFSPEKGYGFIETDDGDLFVHFSQIAGEGYRVLVEGQLVAYSVAVGDQGPEAVNVVVLDGEAQIATPPANDFDNGRRYEGVVKWFDVDKGYGFIETDEGDFFVHFSGIADERFSVLEAGQEVEFSVENGRRGPQAVGVVVVD